VSWPSGDSRPTHVKEVLNPRCTNCMTLWWLSQTSYIYPSCGVRSTSFHCMKTHHPYKWYSPATHWCVSWCWNVFLWNLLVTLMWASMLHFTKVNSLWCSGHLNNLYPQTLKNIYMLSCSLIGMSKILESCQFIAGQQTTHIYVSLCKSIYWR
jgi:hypothetical protein